MWTSLSVSLDLPCELACCCHTAGQPAPPEHSLKLFIFWNTHSLTLILPLVPYFPHFSPHSLGEKGVGERGIGEEERIVVSSADNSEREEVDEVDEVVENQEVIPPTEDIDDENLITEDENESGFATPALSPAEESDIVVSYSSSSPESESFQSFQTENANDTDDDTDPDSDSTVGNSPQDASSPQVASRQSTRNRRPPRLFTFNEMGGNPSYQ